MEDDPEYRSYLWETVLRKILQERANYHRDEARAEELFLRKAWRHTPEEIAEYEVRIAVHRYLAADADQALHRLRNEPISPSPSDGSKG